jgi:pimeloyl-ACP methyl ester carboxylesterase
MAMARRGGTAGLSAIIVAACMLVAAGAAAGSLGGKLELQDEGSFFVNGKVIEAAYPNVPATGLLAPGHVTVNQMYVQYRIPATVSGPPVIMVHGANHTGMTFETTPDGREGWATYFVRHGFPVYVVDHSGRGRSGFNSTGINRAKAEGNAAAIPSLSLYPHEGAWVNFLFGPSYGTAWPDEQFPLEAQEQYYAQIVPNTEATLDGGDANTIDALTALVDKIGPAVLLVHSQSGS